LNKKNEQEKIHWLVGRGVAEERSIITRKISLPQETPDAAAAAAAEATNVNTFDVALRNRVVTRTDTDRTRTTGCAINATTAATLDVNGQFASTLLCRAAAVFPCSLQYVLLCKTDW